jgi:diguanylate cyclase
VEYSHTLEQAQKYADAALARIAAEALAPSPDNFALWYVYYSGQNPDVKKAIDILIANSQDINNERCRELYLRFLAEGRDEETVRRAGDQLNATIKNVSGAVRDVKSATSAYTDTLGSMSGRIKDVKDPTELKNMLTTVMSETKVMLEQNVKLEEQLDYSAHVMEELQRDLENVRREALTDGLTGLANRKAFDMEIKRISGEALESGKAYTLLMLDIDHFKSFNDNYGHQIGDQVLRLVARTLTDGVKGRDVAARYGGEEFSILLPETPIEAGVHVGNALRKAVATKDVINRNSGEKLGRITLSVGVAEFYPDEEIADLIERADGALYTAKHNGRNQVAAAPTPTRRKEKKG